jgi:hypothetical protein
MLSVIARTIYPKNESFIIIEEDKNSGQGKG